MVAQECSTDLQGKPAKVFKWKGQERGRQMIDIRKRFLVQREERFITPISTAFREGSILPLGILNLLSFLYHRQPCGVFTILTGYSVSGQSKAFNMKSVANKRKE